jgi:predicted nuclease of predicted toxin-antitoxin system
VNLKLDENLGRLATELLSEAGHDISTVRLQGLGGAPDPAVIAVCQSEDRALVTPDLGFSNTLVFPPDRCPAIAVLRLPARPTPDDLTSAVRVLVRALATRGITGRLWVVQRGTLREHQSRDVTDEPAV